jgi:hypothetical protein
VLRGSKEKGQSESCEEKSCEEKEEISFLLLTTSRKQSGWAQCAPAFVLGAPPDPFRTNREQSHLRSYGVGGLDNLLANLLTIPVASLPGIV